MQIKIRVLDIWRNEGWCNTDSMQVFNSNTQPCMFSVQGIHFASKRLRLIPDVETDFCLDRVNSVALYNLKLDRN
jgi:hypothetical protein